MIKVKIYTTPTCAYCISAKEFFDKNDIEYEAIDITKDAEGMKWMQERGFQGVPVIVLGEGDKEEILQGFNEEVQSQIEEELGMRSDSDKGYG
ncbi:TPA: glutaredoxin family protein [archaeon]|nr:glutaredoxin family protein [Candidatus Undinarchaeales archaeon SRR5007147.bin71]